ncbi:hypothetical protein PUN28_005661 [Cardiocondyla obscurior]|uniref:Uncharacterized protein n=1 Tax=Cardiocondyla obscurior TaxID=286306 RepID=A0AAW2G524_9HYME
MDKDRERKWRRRRAYGHRARKQRNDGRAYLDRDNSQVIAARIIINTESMRQRETERKRERERERERERDEGKREEADSRSNRNKSMELAPDLP